MKYHEISWNIMKYHEISWNIIHEPPGCAWEPLGSGLATSDSMRTWHGGSFNGKVCASRCEWCADLCDCSSPRVVGVVAHLAVLLCQLHFDDGDNLVFVLVVHGCWAEWLEWLDGHYVQQRRQACRKFRWVRLLCSEWDERCKLVIWLELQRKLCESSWWLQLAGRCELYFLAVMLWSGRVQPLFDSVESWQRYLHRKVFGHKMALRKNQAIPLLGGDALAIGGCRFSCHSHCFRSDFEVTNASWHWSCEIGP